MGTFAAPGGLTGYAGVIEQRPLAIYLTADGKHAIVGTMMDGNGNDLSQEPLDRLVRKPMTVVFYKDEGGNLEKLQGAPMPDMLPKILGPR